MSVDGVETDAQPPLMAERTQANAGASSLALLAGPILFAIGVVLGFVSNAMIWIGPIDRATFGWAVVVPVCLVAPVLSGLVARRVGERAALLASLLAAAAIAVFFSWSLAANVTQLGCDPNPDRLLVVGHAAPVGLAVGLAFAAAAWATLRLRERRPLAVAVGLGTAIVGGIVSLLVFAAEFGAYTCVPVPN
jgi:hypothetical protein